MKCDSRITEPTLAVTKRRTGLHPVRGRLQTCPAATTWIRLFLLPVLIVFTSGADASAAPPAAAANVSAADRPDDAGDALIVTWDLSPDDTPDASPRTVVRYEVFGKSADADAEFQLIGEATYQQKFLVHDKCDPRKKYLYQVVVIGADASKSAVAESSVAISPTMQWFDKKRAWFGLILIVVAGSVVYFIEMAKQGKDLKIRKIAGLEAVDEAVGRATEMGRKCLFVPGILDINDMQTVAGLTVLSRVAKVAAEYDAKIDVPTSRSLVMTTARETVQASYLEAGRPDAYNEDDIYYLTDEQFGYVAGVTGTMVRDKPAACFYMGAFFAESLLLAETGNSIGAIQVAGTAMPSQLPFFVAACDYTLIGEEFFAASAYLSGEEHQLGSLKGQDVGKVIGAVLLVAGCLLVTFARLTGSDGAATVATFLRDHVLGDKGIWL